MMNLHRLAVGLLLAFGSINHTQAQGPTIWTIAGTGHSELDDGKLGQPRSSLSTNIGNPFGVEIGPDNRLYICEVTHHRVWQLDLESNRLLIVAGTGKAGYSGDGGPATSACLNEPYEVRFASNGDMYFVEMQNHVVRKVRHDTGAISTVAGNGQPGYGGDGGPAIEAQLNRPHSIALGADTLYIADIGNHRIRSLNLSSGVIDSLAGSSERVLPKDGQRSVGHPVLGPRALFLDGDTLWVALREGHSVWNIDLTTNRWHWIAGTGQKGYSGDSGPARNATLNGPKGIAVGSNGKVLVVDTENQVIRSIDPEKNTITTICGAVQGFAVTRAMKDKP